MNTQGRKELQPSETPRGRGSDTRVEIVAGAMFPAPAAPQVAASGRDNSWFSVATLAILIALGAYAAVIVAATYGPVFMQPLMGP